MTPTSARPSRSPATTVPTPRRDGGASRSTAGAAAGSRVRERCRRSHSRSASPPHRPTSDVRPVLAAPREEITRGHGRERGQDDDAANRRRRRSAVLRERVELIEDGRCGGDRPESAAPRRPDATFRPATGSPIGPRRCTGRLGSPVDHLDRAHSEAIVNRQEVGVVEADPRLREHGPSRFERGQRVEDPRLGRRERRRGVRRAGPAGVAGWGQGDRTGLPLRMHRQYGWSS